MKADRIASVIFILIALVFWSRTGDLQYNGLIFPRLLIIFLILLSAVMFGQTFVTKETKKEGFVPKEFKYIITSIIVVFAWVSLLNIAGFIVSSVVMLTFFTVILDLQRPTFFRTISSLVIYALMVCTFWFIFHKFLLVPLPTGYLI